MSTHFDETQHPRGDGGRFVAKPAGESSVSLDGPAASSNLLQPDYAQTRAALDSAVGEFDEAYGAGDHDRAGEAHLALRSAAIRHASTGGHGRRDVESLSHGGLNPAEGPNWARQGAWQEGRSREWAERGFGGNPQPVSVAEVRRQLPVGQKVRVSYLAVSPSSSHQVGAERTVTKQNGYEMITVDADGNPSHNDWAGKRAHVDDGGNLIVAHDDGTPYVAYTPID